jgi:hypothetical protein
MTPENAVLLFEYAYRGAGPGAAQKGASMASSSGTGECGSMAGALAEGFLPPGLESRGQFLAHLPRGVGVPAAHARDLVSEPLLGQDLGNAVLGTTHVLWPCRRPCGVSPSLTGSQQASGVSPAGGSPLPGQWPGPFLWAMVLPSSRSLTACPQDGQRPVSAVLVSRWVPRPDGGAKGFPGAAGGQAAAGVPGHAVASAMTSLPGPPFAGGCRPSQAGRKIRRA